MALLRQFRRVHGSALSLLSAGTTGITQLDMFDGYVCRGAASVAWLGVIDSLALQAPESPSS